jgi:phage shock protein A
MIDLEEFKQYLQSEYASSNAEATTCKMYSGAYWDGKADAYDEMLEYIERMEDKND